MGWVRVSMRPSGPIEVPAETARVARCAACADGKRYFGGLIYRAAPGQLDRSKRNNVPLAPVGSTKAIDTQDPDDEDGQILTALIRQAEALLGMLRSAEMLNTLGG